MRCQFQLVLVNRPRRWNELPTWGELLHVLQEEHKRTGKAPFDSIRRKYLAELHEHTGRNVILYATAWQSKPADSISVSITSEDIHGLMEVLHGLDANGLDLIIHSPGGSPEAAEAFVLYLRSKFDDIRVIVPNSAMSAATMLACSANSIIMGEHSFLGPIDPQLIFQIGDRIQAVPAQSILDQFEMAKNECKDSVSSLPWVPILSQYAPALIVQCKEAQDLSVELVSKWLENYMFKEKTDAKKRATAAAKKLADRRKFKSHGRNVTKVQARELGLDVVDLDEDPVLQDLVLSAFYATIHTFNGTPAVKIIENHEGRAFVKVQQVIPVQMPQVQIPQEPAETDRKED